MNTAQQIQNSPATAAGFDIDDLDSVNNATFDVVLSTDDEGNPISGFKIVGKNSAEYQAAANDIRVANIVRSSSRKKSIDTTTEDGAQHVVTQVAANNRVEALAVVVGWFGFNKNGQPLAFDKAIVDKMLTKFPTWIDKVQAALNEDANFMKV